MHVSQEVLEPPTVLQEAVKEVGWNTTCYSRRKRMEKAWRKFAGPANNSTAAVLVVEALY